MKLLEAERKGGPRRDKVYLASTYLCFPIIYFLVTLAHRTPIAIFSFLSFLAGMARIGDLKAPHFRSGGDAHAKFPRDYSYSLQKKVTIHTSMLKCLIECQRLF